MSRTISLLNAALFTLALALPAAAAPRSFSADPQCDGPKTDKDGKKNPSLTDPECGGPKGDSKDEKKNPS
ncbi:MAG: hypothetical protein QM756_27515 [Polyangiaceae bacterium]